jgi:hypothetical protein
VRASRRSSPRWPEAPAFRRQTPAATLRQIIYRGLLSSLLGILDGGTVSPSGSWNASPAIGMLGGALPLLTASVSFRFTAVGAAASIDDEYLDPMKSS